MIVPLYAAILALMYVGLSFNVVRQRYRHKTALGLPDIGGGGRREGLSLERAIRAHANFIEYVPLGLLLMFFAGTEGIGAFGLHMAGCALVTGRVLHAYSLLCHESYDGNGALRNKPVFRMGGMMLTLATLALLALYILMTTVLA